MKVFIQAVGLQLACLASSNALVVSLNPAPGMDTNALAGFQAAANYWQSQLTDNVIVNIDVGFSTLGAGILGSAGSVSTVYSSANVRTALINDAFSANDVLAVCRIYKSTNNQHTEFPGGQCTASGGQFSSVTANHQITQS